MNIARKRKTSGEMNNAPNQDESPFNPRTKHAGIFPEPEFDPYRDAEEDIANYFTEKFRELYLKHTPVIIVNLHPQEENWTTLQRETSGTAKDFLRISNGQ